MSYHAQTRDAMLNMGITKLKELCKDAKRQGVTSLASSGYVRDTQAQLVQAILQDTNLTRWMSARVTAGAATRPGGAERAPERPASTRVSVGVYSLDGPATGDLRRELTRAGVTKVKVLVMAAKAAGVTRLSSSSYTKETLPGLVDAVLREPALCSYLSAQIGNILPEAGGHARSSDASTRSGRDARSTGPAGAAAEELRSALLSRGVTRVKTLVMAAKVVGVTRLASSMYTKETLPSLVDAVMQEPALCSYMIERLRSEPSAAPNTAAGAGPAQRTASARSNSRSNSSVFMVQGELRGALLSAGVTQVKTLVKAAKAAGVTRLSSSSYTKETLPSLVSAVMQEPVLCSYLSSKLQRP